MSQPVEGIKYINDVMKVFGLDVFERVKCIEIRCHVDEPMKAMVEMVLTEANLEELRTRAMDHVVAGDRLGETVSFYTILDKRK